MSPRTTFRTLDGKISAEIQPGQVLDLTRLASDPQAATVPRRTPRPPEPSIMEMAGNFTEAMVNWVAAGAPVISEADYDVRSAICEPCEYWSPTGNLWLGKCKAPGCGCTKLKRWLATEVCKHPQGSRWPALPALGNATAAA